MISDTELVDVIEGLKADTLQRWIDQGWVLPQRDNETLRFDPSDVARVRLIYELHYELCIEESSLPVILSLMDQLYSARRSLRELLSAVAAQPEAIRKQISSHLQTSD